jgi:hypothetical protein
VLGDPAPLKEKRERRGETDSDGKLGSRILQLTVFTFVYEWIKAV